MTRRAPEVADRHEALTAPHRARWEAEEIAILQADLDAAPEVHILQAELDAAPEVHPLPPGRANVFVEAEHGHTCEALVGIYFCGYPATVCDLDSGEDEPGFYCRRHAAAARYNAASAERDALEHAPPVRVIRLEGPADFRPEHGSLVALVLASDAVVLGRRAVEAATEPEWFDQLTVARHFAERAAHFALLALGSEGGAESEAPRARGRSQRATDVAGRDGGVVLQADPGGASDHGGWAGDRAARLEPHAARATSRTVAVVVAHLSPSPSSTAPPPRWRRSGLRR